MFLHLGICGAPRLYRWANKSAHKEPQDKAKRDSEIPRTNVLQTTGDRSRGESSARLLGRETAEGSYTFVPIPPSKTRGDSVYDDRTMLVLENAFNGWSSDLQPILAVKETMQADHESVDRMTFDDLLALTESYHPRHRFTKQS